MGSEAIRTWDLLINYVDDDVSKGALWMDSVGDGGAWKNGTEERSSCGDKVWSSKREKTVAVERKL